ncbi:unnamed protein product, partial [Rangifer tarandus platyrhynchus]
WAKKAKIGDSNTSTTWSPCEDSFKRTNTIVLGQISRTGHITLLVAGLKPQGPGWTPKLTTAQHGPLPELQTQRRQQKPSNTDTAGQQEAEEAKAQVEA